MNIDKGFYKKEGVPIEEIERLKKIDYPNFASIELIDGIDLKDKKFLDVGAGSNSNLGEFVKKNGGNYIALDLRMEMLKNIEKQFEQNNLNFYGIQASVKDLPFSEESIDFIHQRFVLMHLSVEDQKKAVEEILRVSKNESFLLEYDWGVLSSKENEDILGEFRELSFQLMDKFKIDTFVGNKLKNILDEVGQNSTISIKRFSREEADYTNELIDLCAISIQMSRNILKDEYLAEKFDKLRDKLNNNYIKFIPPDIVSAVIRKNI